MYHMWFDGCLMGNGSSCAAARSASEYRYENKLEYDIRSMITYPYKYNFFYFEY
jgi:hypothetical protein